MIHIKCPNLRCGADLEEKKDDLFDEIYENNYLFQRECPHCQCNYSIEAQIHKEIEILDVVVEDFEHY